MVRIRTQMQECLSTNIDYPVTLRLAGQLVVIVGAGRVGSRKLNGLSGTGARIKVIDPSVPTTPHIAEVEHLQRPYQPGDLAGADLVFICTDSPTINQSVADEAKRLSIWSCRSDLPRHSEFSVPAVLRRGELTIAVSTGGRSPALAALMRDHIAEQVPDSWGKAVEIIAAIRRKWLTEQTEVQYNQEVLRNLIDRELIHLIAGNKLNKIDQLLLAQFGPGFSLAELQVQISKEAL
ncbi:MAG TPA: bifunctional precorrin-2 dehydrogenase/sirohydrochlorin ferrochelatase [Geopsychrobacteraceae bacterium]|nr:bifunctional precorrin-2 dehydrogenase/sirohydrochlorin ferrochelatase [Geopsychrobacteraceae bacterium]